LLPQTHLSFWIARFFSRCIVLPIAAIFSVTRQRSFSGQRLVGCGRGLNSDGTRDRGEEQAFASGYNYKP
jgi:hypothetical protein